MLKFKSMEDIERQLLPQHSVYSLLTDLCHAFFVDDPDDEITYDPENDGFVILLEQHDLRRPLTDLWPDTHFTLTEIPWESWTEADNFYIGIYLANNQYGLVFLINKLDPDEELEKIIKSHL